MTYITTETEGSSGDTENSIAPPTDDDALIRFPTNDDAMQEFLMAVKKGEDRRSLRKNIGSNREELIPVYYLLNPKKEHPTKNLRARMHAPAEIDRKKTSRTP